MMPLGVTARLAEHCLGLGKQTASQANLQIASHCLLDWLAVGRSGWSETVTQILYREVLEEGGNQQATLLNGDRASAMQAALLNGTASHVLDFDDVHLQSRVHPSTPLWSAILAESECLGSTGQEVLQAYIAGVEMQSRIAFAMGESHYGLGWHNTATLSCFGAATAIATLNNLSVEELRRALGICATQAAGMRVVFGTMCKPLHAGKAAAIGMQSVHLAKAGFSAPLDILEMPQGFFELYADKFNPEDAFKNLEQPCLETIIFKYNSSCYGTQAPIEACKNLLRDYRIEVKAITRISIEIEPQYLSVCCIQYPKTPAEAKFSIAFMCALAISNLSTVAAESFSSSVTQDAGLIELCAKTQISGNSGISRANARVTITMNNGEEYTCTYNANLPEAHLETQELKLIAKANTLLGEGMLPAQSSSIIQHVLNLHRDSSTQKLLALL